MYWTIFVLLYLVSCLGAWYGIRRMYLKGGNLYGYDPDGSDIAMVFLPIINTILLIMFLFGVGKEPNRNRGKSFFRINKEAK